MIIIIDGIDEFPIQNLVVGDYVDELEKKVKNNKLITAAETILAIYYGFLFPFAKVLLLGRIGEFERLKEVKVKRDEPIFNEKTHKIKDLKLLEFDEANVKEFTCFKICKEQNGQPTCTKTCQELYEKIKNIQLCKNPTDLNSLIELHKKHPNENIGKITRTKLIIATLFNRITEHTKQVDNFKSQTFRAICKNNRKLVDNIRLLGHISFQSLLEGKVTVQVDEEEIDGIVYLKYKYNNK